MNNIYIILISAITFSLSNIPETVSARQDTTKLEQKVEVVKAYRPSVSDAFKINLMPEFNDTSGSIPKFNYSVKTHPYTSTGETDPITAAELKKDSEKKLGYGYLKLGFGNYTTPYGELFFNKPGAEKTSFGIHMKYLSSKGKASLRSGEKTDAPFRDIDVMMFGKHNARKTTISYDLSYTRNSVNFYGYPGILPSDPNEIPGGYLGQDQYYQKGGFNLGFKSSYNTDNSLKYDSKFHFHSFTSKTGQKENNASVSSDFDYSLINNLSAVLETSADHYSTDLNDNTGLYELGNISSTWVKINPSLKLSGDTWLLQGGFNLYTAFDSEDANEIKIYPKAKLSWSPVEDVITLYAEADGYLQNNHYSAISYENKWINPVHKLKNTDRKYVLSGGLKGKFNTQTSFNLGVNYSRVNNMYLFTGTAYDMLNVPESYRLYRNDFNVIYDNIDVLNFTGEISYQSETDFYFLLKGNYYSYTPDSIETLSHLPSYDITFTSGYRITERLTAFSDLKVVSKREALVEVKTDPFLSIAGDPYYESFTLKQITRVNAGISYDLPGNLKLFGRIDNILNQNYEQWLGYNVQGIRFMAGANISF